ncbi:MAG: hypothetical protein GYA47_05210 [Desulfovibrio sp.]|nr:hypothetical protein [Desulfovibrio sp.]
MTSKAEGACAGDDPENSFRFDRFGRRKKEGVCGVVPVVRNHRADERRRTVRMRDVRECMNDVVGQSDEDAL